MGDDYDVRNCQSLFGYAQEVHERSGGVCQLCGAGAGKEVNFDLWRQLTVEHLIGRSQGGHYDQIKKVLAKKFPSLGRGEIENLAWAVELENMVTACSFCNAMTSRDSHDISMRRVITSAPNSKQDVLRAVRSEVRRALSRKRKEVSWKLKSIGKAFYSKVYPGLRAGRKEAGHLTRR